MKKHRYDIIIYTSCFLALILLIKGVKDYYYTYGMKQEEIEMIETIFYEEPKDLIELNKEELIKDYFYNVRTRQIQDDNISYEEVNSWQEYTVTDIEYIRTITKDYYEYEANINSEQIENGSKKITFYITLSNRQNKYVIKTTKY